MKVQIIMPCINLWGKYTRQALDSVDLAILSAKAKGIDCRVLLIDNASTDETCAEASKRVSGYFAHQRNEERWGFQRSVNFGVNDAFERGYDYAFVLNNDILLHPRSIVRLIERFEYGNEHPEKAVGMVTCLDVHGEMSAEAFAQYNDADKEGCPDAPHPCFSAFMVSKECWDTVGEFDEIFAPAYFEDNDYHHRMKLLGVEAIVYPPSVFYHFASKTSQEGGEPGRPVVTHRSFDKNRMEYVRKWGGMPGEEKYATPYAEVGRPITSVRQNP